jgi:hypothetical protein
MAAFWVILIMINVKVMPAKDEVPETPNQVQRPQ